MVNFGISFTILRFRGLNSTFNAAKQQTVSVVLASNFDWGWREVELQRIAYIITCDITLGVVKFWLTSSSLVSRRTVHTGNVISSDSFWIFKKNKQSNLKPFFHQLGHLPGSVFMDEVRCALDQLNLGITAMFSRHMGQPRLECYVICSPNYQSFRLDACNPFWRIQQKSHEVGSVIVEWSSNRS